MAPAPSRHPCLRPARQRHRDLPQARRLSLALPRRGDPPTAQRPAGTSHARACVLTARQIWAFRSAGAKRLPRLASLSMLRPLMLIEPCPQSPATAPPTPSASLRLTAERPLSHRPAPPPGGDAPVPPPEVPTHTHPDSDPCPHAHQAPVLTGHSAARCRHPLPHPPARPGINPHSHPAPHRHPPAVSSLGLSDAYRRTQYPPASSMLPPPATINRLPRPASDTLNIPECRVRS